MKKINLLLIGILSFTMINAQVAINTTGAIADSSSMLDVSSTNKGLLIPRVALTSKTNALPLTNPATGLIVFNTSNVISGTNTLFSDNFYFWKGNSWEMLLGQFDVAGKLWHYSSTTPTNIYQRTAGNVLISGGIGEDANASAKLEVRSTSSGVLFPQVSIDSLKDVTSIASPANGLIVYNTTQPGVRNDMARGYYYYSTNASTWIRMTDNFNDNKWQDGGLGIQLRDKTDGVEMLDNYTGSVINWTPKVKILKMLDSALLNAKNNINALVLTGVNRKTAAGWENRQKTSIVFENNYLLTDGTTSNSVSTAISSYTENRGTTANNFFNGLAFYTFATPHNTAVNDTPSISMLRHNVAIGAYAVDTNNVTTGRLQIIGFSNGDQLSLRHPSNSAILKWGLYVSSIDSSLNFYSNGSLRANIDRVTGVYSALSDRTKKKNIQPMGNVLTVINKLPVYSYNYLDSKDTDRRMIGLMAQDVQPYFPELVYQRYDREITKPVLTMDYSGLGVLAIKAIQEQQLVIKEQDQKIKLLEEEIIKIKVAIKMQ